MQFTSEMGLYDKVPLQECYDNTGKAPISTKWVDINKGRGQAEVQVQECCQREIARSKGNDLFAAAPPLEVMKLLISTLAAGNKG